MGWQVSVSSLPGFDAYLWGYYDIFHTRINDIVLWNTLSTLLFEGIRWQLRRTTNLCTARTPDEAGQEEAAFPRPRLLGSPARASHIEERGFLFALQADIKESMARRAGSGRAIRVSRRSGGTSASTGSSWLAPSSSK